MQASMMLSRRVVVPLRQPHASTASLRRPGTMLICAPVARSHISTRVRAFHQIDHQLTAENGRSAAKAPGVKEHAARFLGALLLLPQQILSWLDGANTNNVTSNSRHGEPRVKSLVSHFEQMAQGKAVLPPQPPASSLIWSNEVVLGGTSGSGGALSAQSNPLVEAQGATAASSAAQGRRALFALAVSAAAGLVEGLVITGAVLASTLSPAYHPS